LRQLVDMATYVGAHELGHQWWAHQVIGADEQGSTVLFETLAQYSRHGDEAHVRPGHDVEISDSS
jgi:aminopeptidase N